MGNRLSNYVQTALGALSLLIWNKPCRIIITGLDAAGKTSLFNRLRLGEVGTTFPTIGFTIESFVYKNIKFTAYDLGGEVRLRPLWLRYLYEMDAVVYVVDACDRERIGEAAEALHSFFRSEDLRDAKLLVYANKQDLAGSMTAAEVRSALKLDTVTKNPHYVVCSSVLFGEGVNEGLDWLRSMLMGDEFPDVNDDDESCV
ncbi:hypothetical protein PybrP1_013080 [[Pythium] brassicae (nom. inval.)]|nr:hypothetical protein PybrP1_013080 [[Pythium] brassicae (nom. inval.)]